MQVSWSSNANGSEVVEFGRTPVALDRRCTATRLPIPGEGCNAHLSRCVLTGITESERHWYRAGNDAYGWSAVRSFVAPPRPGAAAYPVRIIAFGDTIVIVAR